MSSCEIWECFTLNTHIMGRNGQLPVTIQFGITSNRYIRDMRNMSMNHDYESGSLFKIPSTKPLWNAPLADKSLWRHFRLAIKPRYLGNHASHIKSYYRYQEAMVTLSESVMKNCVKRPLAEKSRWRHIQLAINPLSRKPCVQDEQ